MEISLFDTKDIITTSGSGSGDDQPTISSMTNGGVLSDGNYDSIFG